MTRITMLNQNRLHNTANSAPYLLRIRYLAEGDNPKHSDSINLFLQYEKLYKAMEKRLSELDGEIPCLQIFRKTPWADRSKDLETDIGSMRNYLNNASGTVIDGSKVFRAMQTMIDEVSTAEPLTLFYYFAFRCLGDVFGGQGLNGYNKRLFDEKVSGSFYEKISQERKNLCTFIEQLQLSEAEEQGLNTKATELYQHHIDLFTELEDSRVTQQPHLSTGTAQTKLNYQTCSRFTMFAIPAAAALAAATVYGLTM